MWASLVYVLVLCGVLSWMCHMATWNTRLSIFVWKCVLVLCGDMPMVTYHDLYPSHPLQTLVGLPARLVYILHLASLLALFSAMADMLFHQMTIYATLTHRPPVHVHRTRVAVHVFLLIYGAMVAMQLSQDMQEPLEAVVARASHLVWTIAVASMLLSLGFVAYVLFIRQVLRTWRLVAVGSICASCFALKMGMLVAAHLGGLHDMSPRLRYVLYQYIPALVPVTVLSYAIAHAPS